MTTNAPRKVQKEQRLNPSLLTPPPPKKVLKDGCPCNHPGCQHHVSHPCEGCGRKGGWTCQKKK